MAPGLGRRRVINAGSGERRSYADAKQLEKPHVSSLRATSPFLLGQNHFAGRQRWWTCRDLNSGPLPCQGSALPSCATRPICKPRTYVDLRNVGVWGWRGPTTRGRTPTTLAISGGQIRPRDCAIPSLLTEEFDLDLRRPGAREVRANKIRNRPERARAPPPLQDGAWKDHDPTTS